MKQRLQFVSILLLSVVLFSCSHKIIGKANLLPPIIETKAESQKYNMQLDFRKHHFSGMLIVRQMPDNEIRILGTTYFGLSLFDFSLKGEIFNVNRCIEPMQKKKILQLLERDFKNLFLNNGKMHIKAKSSTFEQRNYGFGLGKTALTLSEFTNNQAEQILIEHPWIGLKIQLNKLNNKDL